MSHRSWCDTCRGDGSASDVLLRCICCPRRFHVECAGLRSHPGSIEWKCPFCNDDSNDDLSNRKRRDKTSINRKKRTTEVRKYHKTLKDCSLAYLAQTEVRTKLKPFVNKRWLDSPKGERRDYSEPPLRIDPSPPFLNAILRPYQVAGVNWLLSRYALGTGGILADEMGLGKTIQTLAFLAMLKKEGLSGPHLVVTPLAVLQNWANEIKKFTPNLTFVKVHGSLSERDRLLSRDDVLGGDFDIYITTYDTFMSEEAFFTETFLFHTVVIDEGHRLKNASSKLCQSLARLSSPFRVLLTGTPLQNCLAELMALLQYVLPLVPLHEELLLPPTQHENKSSLDRDYLSWARTLLEASMIRRVKSDVESSLLPKIEYVLKPPLTRLQRTWYRSFLESDEMASGLLSKNQLMMKVLQLGKVANHPKTFALTYDRERAKAAAIAKRAEGSMFCHVDTGNVPKTTLALAREAELRGLTGERLVASSGKMALLDRLMQTKQREGSRVLVFSQYTLTLDVIEEYVAYRFGRIGVAYLRLDGTTGRIQREMDMRSFNKPGCNIFCYLISTRAGGQGINLATADTVVLYDTCWNPQVDLQAQDRAHRIGQRKQVIIYRLISENTVEERILARARQKLVLDALVIKKQRKGSNLIDGLVDVGGGKEGVEEDMAKLSVEELWKILSEGAQKVFDPAVDYANDFDVHDYDRLLNEAKPAKWDDETGGERNNKKPSVEVGDQSTLDGTIFASVKPKSQYFTEAISSTRERKPVINYDAIDLVDSSDTETPIVVHSTSSELSPRPQSSHEYCKVIQTKLPQESRRRSKRARAPPNLFVPPSFSTLTTKKRKINHDVNCFCCRKRCSVPDQTESRRVIKNNTIILTGPLECIACPRVYHLKCSGESVRPKTRSWYCPWHTCVTCNRKSSDAGGSLFHCVSCPLTYCFDCAPDAYTEGGQSTSKKALSLIANLEARGMASLKSYFFFTCGDCKSRESSSFSSKFNLQSSI